jgi:hypothetical protein
MLSNEYMTVLDKLESSYVENFYPLVNLTSGLNLVHLLPLLIDQF